jgi:hypothetical protein
MPSINTARISPAHLYIFFALNLILPVSQNEFRLIVYALFALASIAYIITTRRFFYAKWSLIASIISIIAGSLWLFYGVMADNPGTIFSTGIYLIWPVFFILFSSQITSQNIAWNLHKIVMGFTVFLAIFVANFILIEINVIPNNPLNYLDLGQAIVFYEGYSEMRLYPISTLVFVIPYLVAYFLSSYGSQTLRSRIYSIVCILCGMFVVVLAGRRALMLNAVLAPVILFALSMLSSWELRRNILNSLNRLSIAIPFLMICIIILPIVLQIDLSGITRYIQDAFRPSESWDAKVRIEQTQSLLAAWIENPLIGQGLGAATSYTRSERPWEYEIQYAMLLFQIGILGLSLYLFSIMSIYVNALKVCSKSSSDLRPIVLSSLVGLTSFLIANASNPYMQAFGHLWVVFLPIGLINLLYLGEGGTSKYG